MSLESRITALAQAVGADIKAILATLAARSTGVATIDFGTGSNEASVSVTGLTAIAATSTISLWVSTADTTGTHTANDHRYLAALCAFTPSGITPGVGFTIYATSVHKLTGQFKVRYSWSS